MKLDRGMTRREMLKGALLAIPGFVALMAASKNALAAGAKPAAAGGLVSENDPTAKALKYVADGSKTAKGRPAKMGVDGDKQVCSNCQFYTGDDKQGKCLMITAGQVTAKGWCASWTKKA